MSDNLAFKATYADWKLIKTRGVVQVILEVPLHDADAAYQVLGGMPEAATERWFGVARLNVEADKPVKSHSRVTPEKRLVQQAGISCSDSLFQNFLRARYGMNVDDGSTPEERAAKTVRDICGIESRSEIIVGSPAAKHWDRIVAEFELWKRE